MPVPVDSLVATTLATLAVQTSLNTGAPVRLERPARPGTATASANGTAAPAPAPNGSPA